MKGYLKSDSAKEMHKGELLIPNLSEEHSVTDVDINISLKDNAKSAAFELKEYFRKCGFSKIRSQLQIYIDDLRQSKFCILFITFKF